MCNLASAREARCIRGRQKAGPHFILLQRAERTVAEHVEHAGLVKVLQESVTVLGMSVRTGMRRDGVFCEDGEKGENSKNGTNKQYKR